MSLRTAIEAELAILGDEGIQPFDVHSHTGVDVDGTTRTAEEHVRAVETHLRHVYQKLDVAKRTELASLLTAEQPG